MPAAAESKRFLRFVMTSGFAAAVNLGSRWIFSHYMSFEWAVIVAFFFGVTTAYALARKYVFRNSGRSIQSEFRRFVAVNLLALGLVWTISVVLTRQLFPAIGLVWHAEDVAHFIGVAAPAAASYLGHRAYTFTSIQA